MKWMCAAVLADIPDSRHVLILSYGREGEPSPSLLLPRGRRGTLFRTEQEARESINETKAMAHYDGNTWVDDYLFVLIEVTECDSM